VSSFLTSGFIVATINLVDFKSELFPFAASDFQALKDHHVSVFRIPRPLLGTLQASLLKKCTVNVFPFSEVYEGYSEKLQASLSPARVKFERNIILIAYEKSDTERINEICLRFQNFMGQYGMKATRETKPRDDSRMLARIEIKPDAEINPSFYFGDLVPESVEIARLHLSKVAALVFTSRPSKINVGRRTFGIDFQDKLGDEWVTAFSRAFDLSSVSTREVTEIVNIFISLVHHGEHYTPPVTPKKTQR
jgi:hypothetical protein